MPLKILLIALLIIVSASVPLKFLHSENQGQLFQGQITSLPPKVFAGQVHYSRIPVQYWEHRIIMIKSMGLNALSVYIMWNYHQLVKGVFDYETGNKNLTKFLQLAKKHNMYVLIRPGPYICGEWDFGGMPARLLGIKNLVLRANNAAFMQQTKVYFESLAPVLNPFLAVNGGPIILLQIENEYGFYGTDKKYIQAIRTLWSNLKIKVDEYYVDTVKNLNKCHWTGANIGINDGINETQYEYARSLEKKGFIFGGQIYPGWITHWGDSEWGDKSLKNITKQYQFLLAYNHSFSMYMVHGGTNFGLTAGANYEQQKSLFQPDVTSYDYNSPINEQGSPNQKFFALKELFAKYVSWQVPRVPQNISTIQIAQFTPQVYYKIFDSINQPDFRSLANPPHFQSDTLKMYNQGMVLYETTLAKKTYFMTLVVHDYALVYLDGKFIAAMDRSINQIQKLQVTCEKAACNLRFLVEAMGHINFSHEMQNDIKGLISIKDDVQTSFVWNVYKLPLDKKPSSKFTADESTKDSVSDSPIIFRAEIDLKQVGDVYFNLSNWGKGYVWVNGINLGRFWSEKGPQYKIFCPGVWLRKGKNEVQILQLVRSQPKPITGDKQLK